MRRARFIISVFTMFLPSRLKIWVLRALCGYRIGDRCRIGFSLLWVENLELADNVYIGHLNVFKRLTNLKMGCGSRISNRNIFTSQFAYESSLVMGSWSSIALDHYFDVTGDIVIGDNCILAGRHSTWFTHSLTPDLPNTQAHIAAIEVGSWCYLGSNLRVTPGARIPDHCFVAMGSVVIPKDYRPYSLLAGNPAVFKREIADDSPFFSVPHLRQPHNS